MSMNWRTAAHRSVTLEPARWQATDRTERVNDGYHDDGTPGAVRSVRLAHLVRGDHTLCGHNAARYVFSEATEESARCPSCAAVGADRFIHRDVTAIAGISYRQLDHWCRQGFLRPDNPDPGQGTSRAFSRHEVEVARTMGLLVSAGLIPSAACRAARSGYLVPGVRLLLEGEPAEACA